MVETGQVSVRRYVPSHGQFYHPYALILFNLVQQARVCRQPYQFIILIQKYCCPLKVEKP